jgi:hypothetical protein
MAGSIVKNDYQDMGADIQAEYAMLKQKYPGVSEAEIMQMISAGEPSVDAPTMSANSAAQNPPAMPDAGMVDMAGSTDSRSAALAKMGMGGQEMEDNTGGDKYYVDRASKGVTMAEDRGTNTGANLAANMGMTTKFSPRLQAVFDQLDPELKAEMAGILSGDIFGDEESADEIADEFDLETMQQEMTR